MWRGISRQQRLPSLIKICISVGAERALFGYLRLAAGKPRPGTLRRLRETISVSIVKSCNTEAWARLLISEHRSRQGAILSFSMTYDERLEKQLDWRENKVYRSVGSLLLSFSLPLCVCMCACVRSSFVIRGYIEGRRGKLRRLPRPTIPSVMRSHHELLSRLGRNDFVLASSLS